MTIAVPSLILIAGVVDDIWTKKFHNWLFLVLAGVAAVFCLGTGGLAQLGGGFISAFTAFMVLIPMVVLKVVGAGDLKLMVVFGLSSHWEIVLEVVFYSLFWALIFGIIKATLDGQLKTVFMNLRNLATRGSVDTSKLHRIPYSVPLFFGWLSQLVISGVQKI